MCEWFWDNGLMDETIALVFEMDRVKFGSDNHAILWSLANDNTKRVKDHIHRVIVEEIAEGDLLQMMREIMEEML
jgi:predicted ThiF/HesA family dinucleotide-utilizing enzyme